MATEYVIDPDTSWVYNNWKTIESLNQDFKTFGFIEIPFDYAVSYRPGTRFAPKEILEAFDSYSLYCTDKKVSIENTNLLKLGAIDIQHSFEKTYQNIISKIENLDEAIIPIILGGDHSISEPVYSAIDNRNKDGKTGLIVFDTHFDYRKPVKGKEHSGNWLYNLNGIMDYNYVALLGIAAPIYSPKYSTTLESKGVMIKSPYEIRKEGWKKILKDVIYKMEDCNKIHISFDIDVIDQGFTKATSVPNPNGLYPYEVMDAIFELSLTDKIGSIDIVEISTPFDDRENTTSHIAAHSIMNFIAGSIKS